MNQLRFGEDVIDTDDIRNAFKIGGEGAQRRVFFKLGGSAILRGEAEKDFDLWAATLPRAGEARLRREDLQGDTEERLCYTCDRQDDKPGCCAEPFTPRPYPDCYKKSEEETPQSDPRPLCKTCACFNYESRHCAEFAENHYPECFEAKPK